MLVAMMLVHSVVKSPRASVDMRMKDQTYLESSGPNRMEHPQFRCHVRFGMFDGRGRSCFEGGSVLLH